MKLPVNSSEWEEISDRDRAQIEEIVGAFFRGDSIAPTDSAPSATEPLASQPSAASLCESACNIAEAGAVAACNLLDNDLSRTICISVARAAGNVCRDRCS